MGKKRVPGKPFSPGNEVENKAVIKVVDTGTKVVHWRYLVRTDCCGAEQILSHDALRRIESTEKGTMCPACLAKDHAVKDRRRRRIKKTRRSKPVYGSPEWAHKVMSAGSD